MRKVNKIWKTIFDVILIVVSCIISAIGLHTFVYPFDFAPSGVDGIATILQSATNINAGIYFMLINVPLMIVAFIFINKKFFFYTLTYVVFSSLFLILFKEINFYQLPKDTEKFIPVVFSGILLGIRTGIMIWLSASTGGVDIIAAVIQKNKPHVHIENIITIICIIIMLCSYFVYDSLMSLLLSLLQMIVFQSTITYMMKGSRNAIKVTIVAKNIDEIKNDIINNLKHGGTIVDSRGLYGAEDKSKTIHSIINCRQLPQFLNLMKKYNDAFIYYSEVKGVYGNFRWKYDDEVK